MTEETTAATQTRVVSLLNEAGETYDFAILQDFEHQSITYSLAMTESFPDQLFIIERQGEDLRLVLDEARLQTLQAHLEQLAAEVQTVTVADENGKEFTFQIVQELELEGQKYMLGLDVNGGTELVAFQASQGGVEVVTDEDRLAKLQAAFQASRGNAETMRITLETEGGEQHEFMVVGQFQIDAKEYVLAASATKQDELIALAFDGDNLTLIEDPAEQEKINQHLQQMQQLQQQA